MVGRIISFGTFIEMVREFVDLQRRLLAAWSEAASVEKQAGRLLVLADGKGVWHVRKHGCGVCFRHTELGYQIDVHRNPECPGLIDSWRLQIFVDSLSAGTRRRLSRMLAGSTLEDRLKLLCVEGSLTSAGPDSYELAWRPEKLSSNARRDRSL